jgi:thiamine-monophosphate kinase
VDEFELIQRYFVRDDEVASVITGIGDDGAVIRPPMGKDLVAVVDTLIEGVHFPFGVDSDSADYIAHRAVAVNLSDIAAMGADPRWMTLALTLNEVDSHWLHSFAGGLHAIAADHGMRLVGGDTTKGDNIVVTVQVMGVVGPGEMMLRSGAQVGDTIYVSGELGDAAAGLHLIEHPQDEYLEPHGYLMSRFEYPAARLSLGSALAGRASAAIDISDGLYADLNKLLTASGVGADISLDKVPLSIALRTSFDSEQQRQFALCGGDDYELCFTSSNPLPDEINGVPLTAIGEVTKGPGIVCRDGGEVVPFTDSGYRHFQ